MRIIDNRETAEELTLDVFHDVWRRASQYDAVNGPVLGWIINQARSRAIDRLRHEQRRKRVNPHSNEPAASLMQMKVTKSSSAKKSRRECGPRKAWARNEREVIESVYFSDLTYVEVASRFSQPLGTVKTRIRSALRKLRQQLAADKEGT